MALYHFVCHTCADEGADEQGRVSENHSHEMLTGIELIAEWALGVHEKDDHRATIGKVA